MKDGTYYEGQFVNGEINGHGFKHFAGSGCKYTGQFLNGEMHGHGVMQYRDGSIYEGQWHKNKKQGEHLLFAFVYVVIVLFLHILCVMCFCECVCVCMGMYFIWLCMEYLYNFVLINHAYI